jgi:hypothetical protein
VESGGQSWVASIPSEATYGCAIALLVERGCYPSIGHAGAVEHKNVTNDLCLACYELYHVIENRTIVKADADLELPHFW